MCVLTGFQAKWAYDRQAFIASEVLARQVHRRHHIHDWGATLTGRGKNPPAAPGFLWVFGEEGFSSVCVLVEAQNVKALTDHDWDRVQEARRLFPEASVFTVHVWENPLEHGVASDVPPNQPPAKQLLD